MKLSKFLSGILHFVVFIVCAYTETVNVSIDLTRPLRQVDDRFVSVAFGASMIDASGPHRPQLKTVLQSKKLVKLAAALAPAYLRLGGTAADFITFDPDGSGDVGGVDFDGAEANNDLESRLLAEYWDRCGVCEEDPQMDVYDRDRRRIAKREQLLDHLLDLLIDDDDNYRNIVKRDYDGGDESPTMMKKRKTKPAERRGARDRSSPPFYRRKKVQRNFTMTGADWDVINGFVNASGLRLLFDVNVLKTTPWGEWNFTNAASLLRYSAARNYSGQIDYQLGNEPNHYPHHVNRSISAQQLARDYWLFRRLLQSDESERKTMAFADSTAATSSPLLVGPDVTQLKTRRDAEYLRDFLKDGVTAIDAITWHQYYVNGRTATLRQFVDPRVFNVLRDRIDAVVAVRSMTGPSKPIWLTETASAYGGGACGLSDRFVAGFCWLDKLGMSAAMGVDVVMRQTLWKGQYGMLEGDLTFDPRPDYWLTVLFKRLVGKKVLKVSHDGDDDDLVGNEGRVRLYAHCAANGALETRSSPNKEDAVATSGGIVLYGMNMRKEGVTLKLKDLSAVSSSSSSVKVYRFILESNHDQLWSKLVRLNGRTLHLREDDSLPPFKPVVDTFVDADDVIIKIPKFSMAFFVIEGLDTKACQ